MPKKLILIIIFSLLLPGMVCFASEKSRLPGTSIASSRLQADTLLSVYVAAAMLVPNCKDTSIVNTKITSKPEYNKIKDGKKYASSPWGELWTVNACGENVNVPILFSPNEQGTSYVIEADKVKKMER